MRNRDVCLWGMLYVYAWLRFPQQNFGRWNRQANKEKMRQTNEWEDCFIHFDNIIIVIKCHGKYVYVCLLYAIEHQKLANQFDSNERTIGGDTISKDTSVCAPLSLFVFFFSFFFTCRVSWFHLLHLSCALICSCSCIDQQNELLKWNEKKKWSSNNNEYMLTSQQHNFNGKKISAILI